VGDLKMKGEIPSSEKENVVVAVVVVEGDVEVEVESVRDVVKRE
jgi:hypothetical protein